MEASSERAGDGEPLRALGGFCALFFASLAAACHELLGRQLASYLDPGNGPPRWASLGAALAAAVIGVALAHRHAERAGRRLPWLLVGLGALTTASAPLWTFFFARSGGPWVAGLVLPFAGGGLAAAAAHGAMVALGRTSVSLGVVGWLLSPLRLLAIALLLGAAAVVDAHIGLCRGAAGVGAVLGATAAWCPPLFAYVHGRPLERARAARGAGLGLCFGSLATLAAAELYAPLGVVASYPSDVVYVEETRFSRIVVTSGQRAFDLFVDGELRLSSIDEARSFEALVRPAMSAARRRERVLLLGLGEGMAEREILAHPGVASVTLVTPDASIPALSRRMPWLSALAHGSLDSPKLHVVEAEPLAFLVGSAERFDVAIVDLPAPATHARGKHFTVYAFRLLAARVADDGVLAIRATSSFATPGSFAGIVATLRESGLATAAYRAAVPTFGEFGFVLAGHTLPVPSPAALLPGSSIDRGTLDDAFVLPADVRAPPEPSRLFDQRIVASYEAERQGARRFR